MPPANFGRQQRERCPMMPHNDWPSLSRGLVAILRGVNPAEIVPIGMSLAEAGFEAIEVPLNSPDPFQSIEKLARALPHLWIGAGTVLRIEEVDQLHQAGGRLMISPNINPEILERAHHYNMVTMPGVFTPTEALQAINAKASALKFFPAHTLGPKGIAAIKAVLPSHYAIGAVGGIDETSFLDFMKQGVKIFGLGSSLYKPGYSANEVAQRAKVSIVAYDEACESLKE